MAVRDFGPINGLKMYKFWCEGCKLYHNYDVGKTDGTPNWTFNGDFEKPTFSPSLFYTRSGCHLFVENGMIRYLTDCHHTLAGQTIPLPQMPNKNLR